MRSAWFVGDDELPGLLGDAPRPAGFVRAGKRVFVAVDAAARRRVSCGSGVGPRPRAMTASRRLLTCLAVVGWFATRLAAQSDPVAAANAELEALLAEWRAAQAAYLDAMLALADSPALVEARQKGDMTRLRELRASAVEPDPGVFGRRALALADKYDDHGGALVVAAAVRFSGDLAVALEAADRLGGRYVMDPALLVFMQQPAPLLAAVGWDRAITLLTRIEEAHEDDMVAAWAKYWLARSLVGGQKEAQGSARVAGLLAAAERLAVGTPLAERIAAPRFQKERLQVGMIAPDLVGEDMAGLPLRLSDLRGKVVVLWFWSFANSNCRAQLPKMVQLHQDWQGKPLVVLGVNADVNADFYARSRKQSGVEWRSFRDGQDGQSGPIATRWNVRTWPTCYVFDHDGLIQFHGSDAMPADGLLASLVAAALAAPAVRAADGR